MTFSCPHFDMERDHCNRVRDDCVPGRPGCVLPKTCVFAIPVEERLRRRALEGAAPSAPAVAGCGGPLEGAAPSAPARASRSVGEGTRDRAPPAGSGRAPA